LNREGNEATYRKKTAHYFGPTPEGAGEVIVVSEQEEQGEETQEFNPRLEICEAGAKGGCIPPPGPFWMPCLLVGGIHFSCKSPLRLVLMRHDLVGAIRDKPVMEFRDS